MILPILMDNFQSHCEIVNSLWKVIAVMHSFLERASCRRCKYAACPLPLVALAIVRDESSANGLFSSICSLHFRQVLNLTKAFKVSFIAQQIPVPKSPHVKEINGPTCLSS
jgi:hypothetical protein